MPNALSPTQQWLMYVGFALIVATSCARTLRGRSIGRARQGHSRPGLVDTPMPLWERAMALAGHASLDILLVLVAVDIYAQIASGERSGEWSGWTLYVWAAVLTATLAIASPLRLWQTAKGRRELFPWRDRRS